MGELIKTLRVSKSEKIITVIDACFSGRGVEGGPIVKGLQPLAIVQLSLPKDPRLIVFTGAKHDEFAGPLPGENRPAFSYLSLGGLRGWADTNGDKQVTAGELHTYTAQAIRATVRDRIQTPVLSGNSSKSSLNTVMSGKNVGAQFIEPEKYAGRIIRQMADDPTNGVD